MTIYLYGLPDQCSLMFPFTKEMGPKHIAKQIIFHIVKLIL